MVERFSKVRHLGTRKGAIGQGINATMMRMNDKTAERGRKAPKDCPNFGDWFSNKTLNIRLA